jgi:hypothetical protein
MSIPIEPVTLARRSPCTTCRRRCLRMWRTKEAGEVELHAGIRRVHAGDDVCGRCAVMLRPPTPPTEEQLAQAAAATALAERVVVAYWERAA